LSWLCGGREVSSVADRPSDSQPGARSLSLGTGQVSVALHEEHQQIQHDFRELIKAPLATILEDEEVVANPDSLPQPPGHSDTVMSVDGFISSNFMAPEEEGDTEVLFQERLSRVKKTLHSQDHVRIRLAQRIRSEADRQQLLDMING